MSGRKQAARAIRWRLFAVLACFACAPGWASTRFVTNAGDSGAGSLRDQLAFAIPGDTVEFAPVVGSSINLTGGAIAIPAGVTISGPGANTLTVNSFKGTIFTVGAGETVQISGLTLSGGNAVQGGAIYNLGTLTLTGMAFSANTAGDSGGAIYNGGALTIRGSTLSGNSVNNGDCAGGGAIRSEGAASTLAIVNSTITGNSANNCNGGGISFSDGTATIVSSTIDANTAGLGGGNIYKGNAAALLNLRDSIVSAGTTGGGTPADPDLHGAVGGGFTSLGYNLVQTRGDGSGYVSSDLADGTAAMLGTLANNGGPTTTQALAAGSPALNVIPIANCVDLDGTTILFVDQRGSPRLSGANLCDIGAYQRLDLTVTPTVLADAAAGVAYGVTLSSNSGAAPYTCTATGSTGPFVLGSNCILTGTSTFATTLSFTVTVTDAFGNTGSRAYTLRVGPGPANTLAVAAFPSPTAAGATHNFSVTAKDQFGNVSPSYSGTVHFSSSDLQAGLPTDYTFTPADAGTHTFAGTLRTAGTQSITAADTVTSSITGTQAGIVVSAGAATSIALGGYPSPATAGVAHNVTVTATDGFGNVATGYTGILHFSSSDAQALLPGDSALSNGVGIFSATLKTAGTQSISAKDVSNAALTGTQGNIVVDAAAMSAFTVGGYPSPVTAGTSNSFTVTTTDAYGNPVTGYTGMVHFSSSDPRATLPADYTFTATDAGVHTFIATLITAGSQSITAQDTVTASISGTQSAIAVVAAAPASLTVGGYPTPVTAGNANNFTVTAKDAFGNLATGYAGTLNFTSSDGQAVFVPGSGTLTGGTGSFQVTLKTAGTQSITATDAAVAGLTGSQTGIVVTANVGVRFVVSGYPSPVTAGTANGFKATALDLYGNVATGYAGTIHFTSSDPQAALPTDYTFTATDAGAHTFSATLKTAGMQSLTVTDTAISSITGAQTGISVGAAAATAFTVNGYVTPTTAGAAHDVVVTATDAFGNVATGYAGSVHITSSDAIAALPADAQLSNGVGSFSVTLKTAGTQSITAADTVDNALNGAQSGIIVDAAAAAGLELSGYPSPVTAGTPNDFVVTVRDAFGNVVMGYLGTVHFTSSDAQAALPADYTFVAGDAGTHTFGATLKTAGSRSLTAADIAANGVQGSQTGIVVTASVATTLAVGGYPASTAAGVSNGFAVTAKDAYGNTATGYLGTVHFTSSDAQAVLPGDYTFVAGDAGTRTFDAAFKTSGTQSLTATDTTSNITGAQTGIVVNAGAIEAFVVSGYPSPAVAGTSNGFSLVVKDGFGNIATGYTGTVHFSSSDAQAGLPADYTFTAGDAGVHTFSAALKTAGSQSISATAASITGTQSAIAVVAAAPAGLTVSGYPSPTAPGASNAFTVTLRDAYGNAATGYLGTVHFTSSDAQAVLPGDYTFVAGDAGRHDFSAALKTAGTQAISATDTANGSLAGTQAGIVVNASTAASMVLGGFPSPVTAGTSGGFNVVVKDAYGNIATGYTGTIHFTSSDTQASLPADYTFTAGDAGTHAFGATLKTFGTQTIMAADTVASGLASAQSGIVVNAAATATLSVTGYPSPVVAGTSNGFKVTAADEFGNPTTGYAGTVHFTSSDAAAALPADAALVGGTGTFAATLKTAGNQTLTATDTATPSITGTSAPIVVTGGAATHFGVSAPATTVSGTSFNLTVTALDAFGNPASAGVGVFSAVRAAAGRTSIAAASSYTGTIHFTSTDPAAVLPADAALANGVGTFTATLKTVGTQTITAADTSNAQLFGTSGSIAVTPAPIPVAPAPALDLRGIAVLIGFVLGVPLWRTRRRRTPKKAAV